MNILHQFDPQGYAIPFVLDDEVIECGPDDPSWGDPAEWPAWTDAYTWELGPVLESEPFAPSLADELDYREWAAEIDRRWADERIEAGPVTDADLAAAGLAVG